MWLPGREQRRRGRGQRPQPRVGREHRDGGAGAADQRAGGVRGELEDLLDGQRRVQRHRGVCERAQLLDVLVLDPGDLAHLAVAAMHALEDRQALAQELGGRQERRVGRPAALRQREPHGGVMGLGEVEHAQLRRHRLAAEVVGDAQLALAAIRQIRREGIRVPGRQLRGNVRPDLLHRAEAYAGGRA